jgi:cytochrome c oxidase cbb3-type subunit 3
MGEGNRTDHIQGKIVHVYDGIEEADNALPTWWLITFYGAIVFAAGYWFWYHEYEVSPHQPDVYAAQMAERAAETGELDPAILVALAEDSERVASGQEIYTTNCVPCHGERAQGTIGPNLTDNAWIHGGAPENIYETVRNGVGTAGMPAWGPALGEGPVQSVVAYVMTLRNTNEEGRPPQGDVYDPSAPSAPGAAAEEAPETEAPAEVADEVEGAEAEPAAEEAPTEEAALEESAADEATEG